MAAHELLRSILPQTPAVEISITSGCLFFLYSLLFGFLAGLFYEFFRILRRILPESTAAVIIEDIVFCLSITVLYICLVYTANYGATRFYSVLAASAGFFIYLKTLGAVIKRMHERLTSLLKRIHLGVKDTFGKITTHFKKYINPKKSKKEH